MSREEPNDRNEADSGSRLGTSRGIVRGRPIAEASAGMTLIELMITIAVMTILLTLAAPSFLTLLMNNRLNGQTSALVNGMNYARSTALSTNDTITFCPIGAPNSVVCGTNWSNGWMVVDLSDATRQVVLLSSTAASNSPALASVPMVTLNLTSAAPAVNFYSNGLTDTQAGFTLCDSRSPPYVNSVMISVTGSVLSGSAVPVSPTPTYAVWGDQLACPAS